MTASVHSRIKRRAKTSISLALRFGGRVRHEFDVRRPLTHARVLQLLGETVEVRWARAGQDFTGPPRAQWSSFDRTPWNHPWLTQENMRAFRSYSDQLLDTWLRGKSSAVADIDVAFVGNMANANYVRAAGLRRLGARAPVYLHPDDHHVLGQPAWEEFDGEMPFDASPEIQAARLPIVPDVFRIPDEPETPLDQLGQSAPFLRPGDVLRWPGYMRFLPTLRELAKRKVLVASQCQYLAYLSGRPYVFGQSGGEIWFNPSSDDELGRIQLLALKQAAAIFVSNPLTLAHMRRYGLQNAIFLPFCLDDAKYAPGPADFREEWRQRTGGEFFVMCSARIDDLWKGSQIALEGFATFARAHPAARLVVLRWGSNSDELEARLAALGVASQVLILPPVGKQRLVRYLRSADCLIEQFVLGYYGGSALEAIGCGVPVIMRLEHEQYRGLLLDDLPPVLEAADADEVARALERLYTDATFKKATGEKTRAWFMRRHASSTFASQFSALLNRVSTGARPNFRRSPLHAPLSEAERRYHQTQLDNAPTYPSYV